MVTRVEAERPVQNRLGMMVAWTRVAPNSNMNAAKLKEYLFF